MISPFSCKIGLSNHSPILPEQTELFVFRTFAGQFLSAPSTNSSASPAGLLAASGIADFTASRICIIEFQSDGERLPGSCCSIVSLTSGPIKRAQTAKKVLLGWARGSWDEPELSSVLDGEESLHNALLKP